VETLRTIHSHRRDVRHTRPDRRTVGMHQRIHAGVDRIFSLVAQIRFLEKTQSFALESRTSSKQAEISNREGRERLDYSTNQIIDTETSAESLAKSRSDLETDQPWLTSASIQNSAGPPHERQHDAPPVLVIEALYLLHLHHCLSSNQNRFRLRASCNSAWARLIRIADLFSLILILN
jgi:hypothetical protein